jgi:hypothetical protein
LTLIFPLVEEGEVVMLVNLKGLTGLFLHEGVEAEVGVEVLSHLED